MARKIQDPDAATDNGGTTFVKNQVNEKITFKDGSTYVFPASRHTIHDPELAAKIQAVAEKHNIFVEEQ